jgi:hypothetical protein
VVLDGRHVVPERLTGPEDLHPGLLLRSPALVLVTLILLTWHYGPTAAFIGPLVIDGLMTISGFALLTTKHTKESFNGHAIGPV